MIVIGTMENLQKAITENPTKRDTGLKDFLDGDRSKRRISLAGPVEQSQQGSCSHTSTTPPSKKPRL